MHRITGVGDRSGLQYSKFGCAGSIVGTPVNGVSSQCTLQFGGGRLVKVRYGTVISSRRAITESMRIDAEVFAIFTLYCRCCLYFGSGKSASDLVRSSTQQK